MDNVSESAMKDVVNNVAKILMNLDVLNDLPQEEKTRLNNLAGQVIGLRDTNQFNIVINIDKADIQRLRRDLASAISSEKFVSGFFTALQLLSMIGGI